MSLRYAFNWSIWISAACALYVAGYMLSPLYGSGVMAASFMAMPVYFTMGAPRSGYWHYISSALAGVAWGCLYNTATAVLHTAGLAGLVAATLPVFVITTVICTIHFTFFTKGLISSVPMIFAASAAIAVFGEDKWLPVALSLCGGITLGRISQAGTALLNTEGRWQFRLLSARR
ncbi:DUF1097 domain-containing protein [Cronobacter dublinensis subsp. dublinensis]|nr:DUF1097 domain-containing protein [Cronobacter dublinensis subsp. dublinensis]EGT5738191.1 DUF1097 domain-containing protein [Cronobacter dublinensis subsp. dublinensis]